jgi:hypothetical protein
MLGTDNIAWYTDGIPGARIMAAKTMLSQMVALRNVGQQGRKQEDEGVNYKS